MKMPWPKARRDAEKGGWVISKAFLREIQENVIEHDSEMYAPSLVGIEAVLMALVRLGMVPNEKASGVPERSTLNSRKG